MLPFGGLRSTSISILVGIAYYIAAKTGFALTFQPHPVSVLWLPNSILLAAFLLNPVRIWWLLLFAALPAHLAVELGSGVPWTMVLCWFISNSFEAILGAVLIRTLSKGPVRFDTFRNFAIFLWGGALVAPLLSSFLDAGFVMWNHYGDSRILASMESASFFKYLRLHYISAADCRVVHRPANFLAQFLRGAPHRNTSSRIGFSDNQPLQFFPGWKPAQA